MTKVLLDKIEQGDFKAIARAISLIENEEAGYLNLLESLHPKNIPVIGITGAPGTGKSTLTDSLIENFVSQGKRVAVICIDPSSPFNNGALLGDRIRMSQWYNNPAVYIRSLASRGNLGGLHAKSIEITDILKSALFDIVIIETVGVGQNEVEIAGLADVTLVVLVPSSGDEIQNMKAGLIEIADIFVLNKADLPGADQFVYHLKTVLVASNRTNTILKTVAVNKEGIDKLAMQVQLFLQTPKTNSQKVWLLAEKLYQLISAAKMKNIHKQELYKTIEEKLAEGNINLYQIAARY